MQIVLDKVTLLELLYHRNGILVGLITKTNQHVVLGYCACAELTPPALSLPNLVHYQEVVEEHYPAGCKVVGVWVHTAELPSMVELAQLENELTSRLAQEQSTHNKGLAQPLLVVIHVSPNDPSKGINPTLLCYTRENSGRLSPATFAETDVTDVMNKNLVMLQLKASLQLHLSVQGVSDIHKVLSEKESSMKQGLIFVPRLNKLLKEQDGGRTFLSTKGFEKGTVEPVELVYPASPSPFCAPTATLSAVTTPTVTVTIPLSVVGVFDRKESLGTAGKMMIENACRQLLYCADKLRFADSMCNIQIRHYVLPGCRVPVSVVYPHSLVDSPLLLTDEQLLPLRKELHKKFCLSLSQPLLRLNNRQWKEKSRGPHLISPHLSVKQPKAISGGVVAMVTGDYAYHHYMQDGMNDDGWGCAYRSLQTLWSWFLLQGYTDKPAPSHRDIQQALVDVGDKSSSLVGSNEWIGSFEVSTVLSHFLQIESKIHYISSGSEMPEVGRVLLQHFRSQGTPVMIGGGVLAHTILGVEFSETEGDVRFLILDPHYTGTEHLKTVLERGWCGWKGVKFWDQQAHYNMCMPQRPEEF